MDRRGLLSRLSAKRPADPIPDLESISNHLRVLLNTALGDSPCGQGLGIVDFVDVMHDFPGACHVLTRSIRETIALYEPRLRNVSVRPLPISDTGRISFHISARMADPNNRTPVQFRTDLRSDGVMDVG
jgi:type VI secretion system protein